MPLLVHSTLQGLHFLQLDTSAYCPRFSRELRSETSAILVRLFEQFFRARPPLSDQRQHLWHLLILQKALHLYL